jgi:hypothetical protein
MLQRFQDDQEAEDLCAGRPSLEVIREALLELRLKNQPSRAIRDAELRGQITAWKEEANTLRHALSDQEHTISALRDAIQSCGRSCYGIARSSEALGPKVDG